MESKETGRSERYKNEYVKKTDSLINGLGVPWITQAQLIRGIQQLFSIKCLFGEADVP